MGPGEIRDFCPVDDAGHGLLRAAVRQLNMSAQAYHRTLKLARTIADLAGAVPHAHSGVLRKEASHSGSRRRIWRRRCSIGRGGRYEADTSARERKTPMPSRVSFASSTTMT